MTTRHISVISLILASIAGLALLEFGLSPATAQNREPSKPESERRQRARPPEERPGDERVRPPGERPGRERWSLGATVDSLDTGVRVRNVVRGSAAERAGLEREDIIVNVNGYQVGRVNGREYPLGEELQAQADGDGRVRLLVQNQRNRELLNLDVRLDREGDARPPQPREGIVRGDVRYRDNANLPRDAELRIRIVRRRMIGHQVLVDRTFKIQGRSPHAFEVRYALPGGEDMEKSYDVDAEILSGGRRLFAIDGTYRIRPIDSPAQLTINMRRG